MHEGREKSWLSSLSVGISAIRVIKVTTGPNVSMPMKNIQQLTAAGVPYSIGFQRKNKIR